MNGQWFQTVGQWKEFYERRREDEAVRVTEKAVPGTPDKPSTETIQEGFTKGKLP